MAGVITRCSFLLATVLAGSLLVPSPALAEKSSALRSPDPLKAALLSPEDLGSEFTRRGYRTRGLLPAGMMVAIDIVIIRVGNTMIALEHDGNVGEFDPSLTKSAAQMAVT
ncbi:hypothetical protein [Streptosporangium sp. NPDC050280]|uniref:hypothetical protein n=1 Tax=unclassified Streptosporangium TaxID=2632669 RepID=UPI0034377E0B